MAGGQVRGIDEPFIVGGAQLRYPGDPQGPARETVQCRCALTTRLVTRDASISSLPILTRAAGTVIGG